MIDWLSSELFEVLMHVALRTVRKFGSVRNIRKGLLTQSSSTTESCDFEQPGRSLISKIYTLTFFKVLE
jgi:hypothetical protein